ncbi:hypothetical protein [Shimazuella kribbensis]|uniref:hypothetical protein n=1 Tax=Shimazuella kribbensis TaxID=139808 RepID=UPI0003FDA447|nr:hypothetical protein [Shimazuella kribbensis]
MAIQRKFEEIPEGVRLEIAIEIIAEILSDKRRLIHRLKEEGGKESSIEKHETELESLIKERQKMYFGDEEVLKKIIVQYGPVVRKFFDGDKG